MDDRTLEVAVENGSDVNEMEEQPYDEELRYWFVCSLHRIARDNRERFALFAGEVAERAPGGTGDDCVSEARWAIIPKSVIVQITQVGLREQ